MANNGHLDLENYNRNGGKVLALSSQAIDPGEDNGNPLQYSCLENPMDGGAW